MCRVIQNENYATHVGEKGFQMPRDESSEKNIHHDEILRSVLEFSQLHNAI